MFDTMTLTKTVGALCGSLLIFLLGVWFAEIMYHTGGGGHGHGDEVHQAYVIDTGDGGGETEEVVEEVDFATLLAEADPAKGEKLFKKCQACHKLEDGANATGPTLYQVVDRPVQAVGFAFCQQRTAPGTLDVMSFGHITYSMQQITITAYLYHALVE